ncbi:MAG: DUF2919 domain-containing protein [Gammaproteobacteria bacterium]|nr:DUF2919 domain-containing protein [Gammaproteobacteria bacterium]
MSKVYNFSDYDKHLSLKFNFWIWLIIAYFLRPLILKVSTIQLGFGAKSGSVAGLKKLAYPEDFGFFLAILTTIPVLLVIFTLMKRKPDAPDYVRTLWRNGGRLLAFAALLNILVVFVPLFIGTTEGVNPFGWAQLAVAACSLTYLLASRRVRDTFADFPQSDGPGKKGQPAGG